ncbi:MAG: DNA-directed RNA polymerase subunit omega [Microthrixaceae bacterium]
MRDDFDTMMDPQVERLLDAAGSKFSLVSLASRRAREINSYYGHLGEIAGQHVPPQVATNASKYLSIAFQEIAAGAIVGVKASELAAQRAEEEAAAEAAAMADAEAAGMIDTPEGA